MFNRKAIASILIFVGSALCFLLPFATVSCGDQKVATFTGLQLATGTQITKAQPFGGTKTQKFPGNPAAGVAALCALAGVGLSFAGRRLAAGTAGVGGAGVIALLLMKSKLVEQVQTQGGGFAQVSFEPGFVVAFLLLAAGAAWNVYLLVQGRTQAAASTPDNGDLVGSRGSRPRARPA